MKYATFLFSALIISALLVTPTMAQTQEEKEHGRLRVFHESL